MTSCMLVGFEITCHDDPWCRSMHGDKYSALRHVDSEKGCQRCQQRRACPIWVVRDMRQAITDLKATRRLWSCWRTAGLVERTMQKNDKTVDGWFKLTTCTLDKLRIKLFVPMVRLGFTDFRQDVWEKERKPWREIEHEKASESDRIKSDKVW